ncbi:MAG: cupin domain-containing protein [Gammaproteobacteria bacterium]|nr:cupin domain-containing protein [Gammaproteobacteria bacterium]MDH5730549.1 cupin domain-containing protein [Gammaproteobacteria bacterium]
MDVQSGENFSVMHFDTLNQFKQASFKLPGKGEINGKQFVKQQLGLSGMEVSLNHLAAGAAIPFYHRHQQNEELYIIVQGQGQFQIDDEIIDVAEGSLVRIAPQGIRTWRNHSQQDLLYIVIQAKANSSISSTIEDGELVDKAMHWPESALTN